MTIIMFYVRFTLSDVLKGGGAIERALTGDELSNSISIIVFCLPNVEGECLSICKFTL